MNPIQEHRVINQFLKSCGQETIEYNLFTDFLPDDIQDKIYLEAHKTVFVPMINQYIGSAVGYISDKEKWRKFDGTKEDSFRLKWGCFGLREWKIQDEIVECAELEMFMVDYWRFQDNYCNCIDTRIVIRRELVLKTIKLTTTFTRMSHMGYTTQQMKAMCKMNGLSGYSKLNRRQLIKLMMTC